MPGRQQQWLAADLAGQLAESDHRAREGHRTDEDADVDLDFVDGLLGTGELDRGIDVARKADQTGSQTDQTVHQRDEFRHLRHLHLARGIETDAATDEHGADDPGHTGHGDARPEHRRQHGDGHADDAVEIAAAGSFRIGETAETQDEENRGADIGN